MKGMRPIFKIELLIYQSKVKVNEMILFGKGAVIKYGTEGGGRDLTGSAKL